DPGGLSMPVAVARKIEFYIQNTDADVKLFHVFLTKEQCEQYALPRIPIKEKERRRDRFQAQYGEGGTELDALEALHPGEFERILSEAMSVYYDEDLESEVSDSEMDYEQQLEERRARIVSRYETEVNELEKEYQKIREQFEGKMQSIQKRTAKLWHSIRDDLEKQKLTIDGSDIPEAEFADELPDPLLDSERNYFEQLAVYKKFQGKELNADREQDSSNTRRTRRVEK